MRHFIYSTVAAILVASPALAATDPLIEGAKLCTRYLPVSEKRYGIPNNLLAAISSTESGRWHNRLNLALPWPWTINVEGQGYYFDSKQEAMDAVRKFQARGIRSIDVGCMQVNLHHHAGAFNTLSEAFDPERNIDYAARFLRSNYDEERSWRKAAANYHSRTPSRGNEYVGLVHKAWQRIVDRIRGVKGSYQVASNTLSPPATTTSSARVLKRDRESGKMLSRQRTPHEYSISVKNMSAAERSREGGVTVIRPAMVAAAPEDAASITTAAADASAAAITSEAAAVAAAPEPSATPPAEAATTETIIQPKVLSLQNKAPRTVSHGGPRFIFD